MSKNDITGDRLVSKALSEQGRENYDLIFGKKSMRSIYYWPEGTWCDLVDYPLYTHMSDDVTQMMVSHDYSDDEVDRLVQCAIKCSQG